MQPTSAAPTEFACPRCTVPVSEAFYGPCYACRSELRSSLGSAPSKVEMTAFDPKLNVTPNAVALKDD